MQRCSVNCRKLDWTCLEGVQAVAAGFTVIGLVTIMLGDVWMLLLKLHAAGRKVAGVLRGRGVHKVASLP
jgi:hypothetical protein